MEFDLEDYKRRTGRLEWADLDLHRAFAVRPLSEDDLRCIQYMHDVEFHTVCYLRDLLLSPAHNDPTVTAFLSFWVFEEFWHGEALADVLAAHGRLSGNDRIAGVRAVQGLRDLVIPMATAAVGTYIGRDFTALHMAWGAINEWTTQAGYARLSQQADHPTLTALLQRIMKQEGRHIDFYASQAHDRLDGSVRAQRFARALLRRMWQPVGSGVMPREETVFLIEHLFDGDEGRAMARRIDRRVDRLPGLAGLRLVEGALDEAVSPAPARQGLRTRAMRRVQGALSARSTPPPRPQLSLVEGGGHVGGAANGAVDLRLEVVSAS